MTCTGSGAWIFRICFCVPIFVACQNSIGQNRSERKDSTSKSVFVITPRINSAGHFPFSGALLNKNLNVDLNVFYERNLYGFFIFKSQDLEDRHSFVNYMQPGVFKKFRLSSTFKLGAFFGYVFSQTSGFRDDDSDYYTAVVAYWTISDRFKLENTALFFDLSQSEKLANRLLLRYEINDFKFDFYLWQRVVFSNNAHATSASLAMTFPNLRLSETLALQTTISYQGYLTQAKPDFARRNGLLVSVAFPLSLVD